MPWNSFLADVAWRKSQNDDSIMYMLSTCLSESELTGAQEMRKDERMKGRWLSRYHVQSVRACVGGCVQCMNGMSGGLRVLSYKRELGDLLREMRPWLSSPRKSSALQWVAVHKRRSFRGTQKTLPGAFCEISSPLCLPLG